MTERNRNWHSDPQQGWGRTAHDYGRTGPIDDSVPAKRLTVLDVLGGIAIACAFVGAIVLALAA